MTIIAAGRGLRDLANRGMSAVAKAESVEEQQRLALETAKQQQESSTLGTGAGMGGMVGANRMLDASKAAQQGIEGINTALEGVGEASRTFSGGLEFTPTGSETTLTGDAAIQGMQDAAGLVDGLAAEQAAMQGSTEVAGVLSNAAPTAEVVTATQTAGTTTAGAGTATAAVEAGTAAVQSAGPMAQLATMATPIAIGLGVAFLINKLFD